MSVTDALDTPATARFGGAGRLGRRDGPRGHRHRAVRRQLRGGRPRREGAGAALRRERLSRDALRAIRGARAGAARVARAQLSLSAQPAAHAPAPRAGRSRGTPPGPRRPAPARTAARPRGERDGLQQARARGRCSHAGPRRRAGNGSGGRALRAAGLERGRVEAIGLGEVRRVAMEDGRADQHLRRRAVTRRPDGSRSAASPRGLTTAATAGARRITSATTASV